VAGAAELLFIVSYRCPHCQAALEARTRDGRDSSWLRCPKCGRAGLPPDEAVERRHFAPAPGEDLLVIPDYPEPQPLTPVAVSEIDELDYSGGPYAQRPPSIRRVVVGTALFIALTMLVFSFLDESRIGTSFFGAVALALLIVLAFLSRG
jgi:hypothetical protein